MPPSFYHRRPTPSFFLPTPWLLAQPPTHPPTPTLLPPRLCLLCPILSGERGRGMARTALSFAFFSFFFFFPSFPRIGKRATPLRFPVSFHVKLEGGRRWRRNRLSRFQPLPSLLSPSSSVSLSHRRPRSFIFHSQTLLGELGIQAKRFGVIVCSRCSQLSRSH